MDIHMEEVASAFDSSHGTLTVNSSSSSIRRVRSRNGVSRSYNSLSSLGSARKPRRMLLSSAAGGSTSSMANATWSSDPSTPGGRPKLNIRKLALLGGSNHNPSAGSRTIGSFPSSASLSEGSQSSGSSSLRREEEKNNSRARNNSVSTSSSRQNHSNSQGKDDAVDDEDLSTSVDALSMSRSSSVPQDAESILQNRLLNYGIVPLQRKRTVVECEKCKSVSVSDTSSHHSGSTSAKTHSKDEAAKQASLDESVDRVHRWLFVEGGHYDDAQELLENYAEFLRTQLQIQIDRLYYGGVGLHPKLTAYMWKWEYGQDFSFSEMPPEIFERRNEIFSPDEPFSILETGRADFIRIKSTDTNIPQTEMAKWFRSEHYHDYFALPDIHRNQSKGGMAWATKSKGGFSDDHIKFFERTMPALCTVMRVHTNDLVLNTLTERMEMEIEDRTLELAQANEDLAEANDQLEQHQSKQLEHFACMSHEIRTPLNCIVGLSSLMLTDAEFDPVSTRENLKMIHSSADLLNAVVDDVLDYAKMESGSVYQVDIRDTDLQTSVASVVHAMRQKSAAKNISIVTIFGATLPAHVQTDPRRLQQILYNLLGNACKFSKDHGTVELHLFVEQGMLKIAIKDYGKGIAQENLASIFEPFRQENKETSTIYGGTGLGLSITSKLVERLGGLIEVDSVLGEYAQFTVALPLLGAVPVSVEAVKEQLHNTTIMLLEDQTESQHPFSPAVIQEYGLDFVQHKLWQEITDEAEKRAFAGTTDREYVVIVPMERFHRGNWKVFTQAIAKENHKALLILYGFATQNSITGKAAAHWNEISKLFPAHALQEIIGFLKKESALEAPSCPAGVVEPLVPPPKPEAHLIRRETSVSAFSSLTQDPQTTSKSASNTNNAFDDSLDNGMDLLEEDNGDDVESPIDVIIVPTPPKLGHVKVVRPRLSTSKVPTSTLSTDSSSTQSASKEFVHPSTGAVADLKVMYAEDNKINQKVLGRMLTKLGVQDPVIVDDGLAAVEQSETTSFDLIFMDIQMPIMDGLEATSQIKLRDGENSPRIIFCTAHALQDFKDEADLAGADGFVAKPFNYQKIELALNEACVLKSKNQGERMTPAETTVVRRDSSLSMSAASTTQAGACDSAEASPAPEVAEKPKSIQELKILYAEDIKMNQKVMARMLKRLGIADVEMVDNGEEAVKRTTEKCFDLIFMDIQMPIMDGIEATKKIRDRDGKRGPRIIFCTAHAVQDFKDKAALSGGDGFLAKPINVEKIQTFLEDALSASPS